MGKGKLELIARWLVALPLLFFGLNSFFNFMTPPPMEGNIATFMNGLIATGYFLPFLGLAYIFIAILLIFNKWVPLALVILAPISIQIMLYHIFLDLATTLPGLIIFLLNIYLGIKHFDAYRPMFK